MRTARARRCSSRSRVVNVAAGCAPLANVAVEIWQCDVAGNYSQYGSQTARTYLRGIQTTNSAGEVVFTTLYPGWYQGRATHIHVEVASAGRSLKVTQMAFPEDISAIVHTQGVYASRGVNRTTNLGDGIFADSLASEMATVAGSPATGMTATFRVGGERVDKDGGRRTEDEGGTEDARTEDEERDGRRARTAVLRDAGERLLRTRTGYPAPGTRYPVPSALDTMLR